MQAVADEQAGCIRGRPESPSIEIAGAVLRPTKYEFLSSTMPKRY